MLIAARYATPAELAADVDSQLGHGGLLVRGEVPRGLDLFAAVQLEVSCGATAILVAAQVLQLFPGLGVAVSIDADGRAKIAALAAAEPAPAAAAAEPAPVSPPEEEELAAFEDDAATPTGEPDPPAGGEGVRRRTASGVARETIEKIQRALKGDRETRFAIMRDTNRQLHMHVLRNPALAVDEVAAMARMTGVSAEALKHIAARREWGHRPEIAIALVRNPSLPVPIAVELVAHVSDADLKQLAKDTRTREPVQRAARKRLIK